MSVAAVIVAAGSGSRAGGETPKQFRDLAGEPVLARTVRAFAGHPRVDTVAVVVADAWKAHAVKALADAFEASAQEFRIARGGPTRSASVRAGLAALAADPPTNVLIHDAARPLVTPAVIDAVLDALASADGAAPSLASPDALKTVSEAGLGADVDRAGVRAVQTPQGFRYDRIQAAYAALPEDADLPDDVAVARAAELAVAEVPGDPDNFKLTLAADFARAERLLVRPVVRVATGSGFDAHRIVPGDGLTLCGVRMPGELSLAGHSDADAAFHAATDAVLGALGAGDIGTHFPPSDERWRGADSRAFLEHAAALARDADAEIQHVDVTIICERPKIGPHRDAMRAALARAAGVALERASVKATTTEKMGFTGRGEGIAAQSTATLAWRA